MVIHPYVSRHTWLFSMHSVQLLLVHTLWDAMHACLYRLQALCHRYDMGSWVGGCFYSRSWLFNTHVCIEQREDKVELFVLYEF